MVSDSVLQEAVKRLVDGFAPRAVILFGSYARGDADDGSDVDLLVLCEGIEDRWKLALEMDRSLWGLGLARDILVMTPQEFECQSRIPGTAARYAFQEGKVLYGHAA